MAVYNQVLTYTFRDSLASGNPQKVIFGAYLDGEFGAIHTASLDAVSLSQNNTIAGNNSLTGTNTFSGTSITTTFQGSISVGAPGNAVSAVSVTGRLNSFAVAVSNGTTAGQSFGINVIAGTNAADYPISCSNAANSLILFRVQGNGVVLGNDGTNNWELGYKDLPQNNLTGNYTLALSDRGKHVYFSSGTDTLTIPANASVAFPTGSTIVVMNGTGNSLSLQITSDTLNWFQGGTITTGNRTIANGSVITLVKTGSTFWVISGNGIS